MKFLLERSKINVQDGIFNVYDKYGNNEFSCDIIYLESIKVIRHNKNIFIKIKKGGLYEKKSGYIYDYTFILA